MAKVDPQAYIYHGLHNFRDIGGLPIGSNSVTRSSLLYRSDAFDDTSEDDADYLYNDLGIRRVIDLRSNNEIESFAEPSPLLKRGPLHLHRPIAGGAGSAIEDAGSGDLLPRRYLQYLEICNDSIISTIKDLADPEPPVTVVHCRAGKDRTGVLVAIVLSILGVDEETISRDYALTSIGMPRIMERLRESPLYSVNVERLPDEMYSAVEETMRKFLELVQAEHGTLENWALSHGVADHEIEQLKRNYILRIV